MAVSDVLCCGQIRCPALPHTVSSPALSITPSQGPSVGSVTMSGHPHCAGAGLPRGRGRAQASKGGRWESGSYTVQS